MSLWLYNLFMHALMEEVNARVLNGGIGMQSPNNTVLVADSSVKLLKLVSEFWRVCERRKLKVYEIKSKVAG